MRAHAAVACASAVAVEAKHLVAGREAVALEPGEEARRLHRFPVPRATATHVVDRQKRHGRFPTTGTAVPTVGREDQIAQLATVVRLPDAVACGMVGIPSAGLVAAGVRAELHRLVAPLLPRQRLPADRTQDAG